MKLPLPLAEVPHICASEIAGWFYKKERACNAALSYSSSVKSTCAFLLARPGGEGEEVMQGIGVYGVLPLIAIFYATAGGHLLGKGGGHRGNVASFCGTRGPC